MGFAYQLIYVRLLNYFPKQKPFEIVEEILSFSAMQTGIDKALIKTYSKHRQHISRHQDAIRHYLRLKSFSVTDNFNNYLLQSAQRIDQITLLIFEAKQFLKTNNILYPSDDTIERLIVTQREKARQSIFSKAVESIHQTIKDKLDQLLKVEFRTSKLER